MRIGTNPQKINVQELFHKSHRIIIPFWIPNVSDSYFKEQPKVLFWCLKSLTETIDPEKTAITLINNNSCRESSSIAEDFVNKGLIDKYVILSENRGKLETILSEARASFEEFITISDADFLFFPGWEDAVIDVFSNFSRAGLVTCYPCPHLTFHYNSSWLWNLNRKAGKVVSDEDLDLIERGFGNKPSSGVFTGKGVKRKRAWRDSQYYVEKEGFKACIGASHALATMKNDVVKSFPDKKVNYVFKSGYEHDYIDFVPERLGYLRLSTTNCFAYHLGNSLPGDLIESFKVNERTHKKFPAFKGRSRFLNKLLFCFSALAMRFLRKFNMI